MRTLIAAAAALLLLAAPAAARPPLTQARADAAAHREMTEWAAYFDQEYDPAAPDGWVETPTEDGSLSERWNVRALRWELDPCDVDRRSAECDATLWMSDGDACDTTVVVELTRRGRLTRWAVDLLCDSQEDGES